MTAGNFEALQPTDQKFSAFEDLKLLKRFRIFNAKNLGFVGESFQPSNFENDSTAGKLESRPTGSSGAKA